MKTRLVFLLFFISLCFVMELNCSTPRKSPKQCCVCDTSIEKSSSLRRVLPYNKSGVDLSKLILIYGGISVIDGFVCLNCYRKVLNIDKIVTEFRKACQSAKVGVKRCFYEDVSSELESVPSPIQKTTLDFQHGHLKPLLAKRSLLDDSGFEEINSSQNAENIPPKSVSTINTSDHAYHKPLQNPKAQKKSKVLQSDCPINKDNESSQPRLTKEEQRLLFQLITSGGYVSHIVDLLLKTPSFVKIVTDKIKSECQSKLKNMNNEKRGFISVLMKKKVEDISIFSWDSICDEFFEQFPFIANVLNGMMDPDNNIKEQIKPKLGIIYAICAQTKNPKLSLVQRITTACLLDNIADQKIYDRFQPLGLCYSYEQSQRVLNDIGQSLTNTLAAAINDGKRLCIVGDNVNYSVGIREQRKGNEGKTKYLHHAFSSIAVLHDQTFEHLSRIKPQKHWTEITKEDMLLNGEDFISIREGYICQILEAATKHIPFFKFLEDVSPLVEENRPVGEPKKSKCIPLETVLKNEQYYGDVVDILEGYEELLENTFKAAGKTLSDDITVHIGGDQLTRERFSGAKALRAAEETVKARFGHLGPITFEMFHLLMNFLQTFFDFLYKENSSRDLGTLKCEINRVMRTQVDADVKKAYDADKDFVISYVDAHLVEVVCEYFGLEDHLSRPTKNLPPQFASTEEKRQWVKTVFGQIVDEIVWPKHDAHTKDPDVIVDGKVLPVTMRITLANGKQIELNTKLPEKRSCQNDETDKVKNYAHLVLEIGLLFKELVKVCKIPNQKKLLQLLKHSMTVFKSKSRQSKYAFEIHRFLVQQICTLSEKEAAEVVQGMFVNTTGNDDGHIPADLQMEYTVKTIKKHIKHMYSNKSEINISKRTRGLSGVKDICEHYDQKTKVVVRSKKHSQKDKAGDEIVMIQDLRKLRPFAFQPGRSHTAFRTVKKSVVDYLDTNEYHDWIMSRIPVNATDVGN